MIKNQYSNIILGRYHENKEANCRDITLQVTDDCCLKCSYCYQINKGHRQMSIETVKQIIDLLFQMYDEDNPQAYINHNTKGLVLNFIGGEPFMNIKAMEYGTQYFIDRCIHEDHQWLTNFRINISSNGMLYFSQAVQDYLKKYEMFISLNITLDGPQQLHDSCRIDKNGNGSFNTAFLAFKDWGEKHPSNLITKATISPENLKYIDQIFDFFISNNCLEIWANPIYEHKWTIDESKIYYYKLKSLADQLLIKYKNKKIFCKLFDEGIGYPEYSNYNYNYCGGNGSMLAFDPEGNAYPCLRYMESSLGHSQKPLIIGNAKGIYQTNEEKEIYKTLTSITRRTQSTDECYNCHIATGCGSCNAYNYQESGDVNHRSTNICWMHRAQVLANVYYWNKYYITNNKSSYYALNLSRDIAINIISNEEYDMLLQLSRTPRGENNGFISK